MKRKALTFALLGLLTVGSIIPMTAKASESWSYGFDQSKMQWYNDYLHSSRTHFGTITKHGYTYYGPLAGGGDWSSLRLEFDGPYAATYDKHVL